MRLELAGWRIPGGIPGFWVIFLLGVTLSLGHAASGDVPSRVSYREERWGLKRGFPSERINALCEGESGEIWVACPNALVQMRDQTMTVFHAGNSPALWEVADDVLGLTWDKAGTLWLFATHGFARRTNGRLEKVRIPGLENGRSKIHRLTPRSAGGIWIGTEEGVWWFDGVRSGRIGTTHPVFTLMEDDRGGLVVAYTIGVWRMNLTTQVWQEVFHNGPKNPLCSLGGAHELLGDGRGGVLVGVHGAVFRERIEPKGWERLAGPLRPPEADPVPMPMIHAARFGDRILVAGEPESWLSLWSEGHRLSLSSDQGSAYAQVTFLLADRKGTWWVGTANRGLIRLVPNP